MIANIFGDDIEVIKSTQNAMDVNIVNETGEGVMNCYEVFPGLYLMYNDFQLEKCDSKLVLERQFLGVEYCIEGRIEWEHTNGNFSYIGAGDLICYVCGKEADQFRFPLKYYKGITLAWDMEQVELPSYFPFDISNLQKRLLSTNVYWLMQSDEIRLAMNLAKLAKEKGSIHREIATLQLLLALEQVDVSNQYFERNYLSGSQVRKIKEIEAFLTSHIDRRYTLKELSKRFSISITAMRQHFESIYGCSIATYMRNFRIHMGTVKLQYGKETITEIAGSLGYENPSKFSAAFREVMGISPGEYRQNNIKK